MINNIKIMRDVFIEEIYNYMHKDAGIFFLCADFGSPKLDQLRRKFKDRFINVGIAEQNLINIATGLAIEGFTVYAYAIAPFLAMRAFEQIRINLAMFSQLKEINVNLVGVGAGLSYDVSGPTHHCLEDLSIMRTLPNIMVFSPSDWVLARRFVDYSIKVKKPKYIRFDGKPLPKIYANEDNLQIENGFIQLRKGKNVCLIATGFMTHKAIKISQILNRNGIDIGIIDLFLLGFFDKRKLINAVKGYDYIITLEEGFINKGGLDSFISSILDESDFSGRLYRVGFKDGYVFELGSREFLHRLNKIDEYSVVELIGNILKKIKKDGKDDY